MSAYPPPTQILSLFNPLYFETDTADITVGYLDGNYLKFPIAQGLENLQKTNITDTTQSTDTTSGSIVTAGGLGVAKQMYIGGHLHSTSTTQSNDTTSGAIITAGGVGIAKQMYIGGHLHSTSVTQSNDTTSGALQVLGGAGIVKNLNVGGIIKTFDTTASNNSTSGALQVAGGAGIAGTLYTGAKIQTDITSAVNFEGYRLVSATGVTAGYNSGGVRIYPYLSNGAFNFLPLEGDAGIVWGNNTTGTNGGFVIAPHSNNRAGIRINADKLELYYITPMYVTPSFPVGSIGDTYTTAFSSAGFNSLSTTIFTKSNIPVGLYMFSVNAKNFDTTTATRNDLSVSVNTGITLVNSMATENNGTTGTKLGITGTQIIRVISTTNTYTVILTNVVNPSGQIGSGTSALVRIA